MNRLDQPEIERTIRSLGDRMAESVISAGETMQHLTRATSQLFAERTASFTENYVRWMGMVFSNNGRERDTTDSPPTSPGRQEQRFPSADE
jgi:hypothetical protein